MTDDAPSWFGEPAEEPTPSVDPPAVPVDWFGDIESDEIPPVGSSPGTAASGPEAAAGPAEATRNAATEAGADETGRAGAESTSPESEPTTAQASESEMDGTRETAVEMEADSTDDESDGGFVAWLKSLFGL